MEFYYSCTDGHLDRAQQLYNDTFKKEYTDWKWYVEIGYKAALQHGHLPIAEWILTLDILPNIHDIHPVLFYRACGTADLRVAKWLHNVGGTTIPKRLDYSYCMFLPEFKALVQWLLKIGLCDCIKKYNVAPCRNHLKNQYYSRCRRPAYLKKSRLLFAPL